MELRVPIKVLCILNNLTYFLVHVGRTRLRLARAKGSLPPLRSSDEGQSLIKVTHRPGL